MKWIGLTGGLGTGKSTVANILRELGWSVLDADHIAKAVTAAGASGLRSVIQRFGNDFLKANGELNREKLSKEVFSNPETLAELEKIIHPLVQAEVERQKDLEKTKGSVVVFYDVPLLFEKNISGFDAVVVVVCSEEVQKQRIKDRNKWSEIEISNRLKNQLPLSEKVKKAEHVIQNNGSLRDLKVEVERLVSQLKLKN